MTESTSPRSALQADVIVVGAGSSGAVLASRLSEDPSRRVLLIEAGPDTPPGAVPSDIADTFPRSYSNPAYMWGGLQATYRAGDAPRPYTQARVMGGGSSLMGMWALRGLASDYARWRAAGAEGWGWEDVRSRFQQLEQDPLSGERSEGPVTIRRVQQSSFPDHIRALQRAAQTLGLPFRPDINACEEDGFFPIPLSQQSGVRVSSASAYLTQEVRRRKNLTVLANTEVLKLDFDGRRVNGVVVASGSEGESRTYAAREVIISAGAIHSPSLLLRSGLGPGDELHALGLPVIADIQGVGRNLQNHVCVNLGLTLPSSGQHSNGARDYGVACVRMSSGLEGGAPADLMLAMIGRTSMRAIGARVGLLNVFLYDPRSRGTVTLARSGRDLRTRIDFNLMSDQRDSARMAAGLEMALQLLRSPECATAWHECFALPPAAPLQRLNRPGLYGALQGVAALAAFNLGPWSRKAVLSQVVGKSAFLNPRRSMPSRQELEALCRQIATPMFHVAGTCAMGDADATTTVVDPQCRVVGVEGLRVVDASIMPTVPRANTNLPALMIGERAARLMARREANWTNEGVLV